MIAEQVKQEIIAAFAGLPLPTGDALSISETLPWPGVIQRFQDAVAGREWMSLDAATIKDHQHSFGDLSSEGYRYYLPALLLWALDAYASDALKGPKPSMVKRKVGGRKLKVLTPHPDPFIADAAVKALQPNYRELYISGRDEELKKKVALLNGAQQRAVCSFLGWCLNEMPAMSYMHYSSAKALKWGWNQQKDHPALEQSRRFFQSLHLYDYPPAETAVQQQVIEKIREGFTLRPVPDEIVYDTPELREECRDDDVAAIRLEFCGLNWRTLHPEFLSLNYEAPSYLTHQAFCYYLPAFLIADVWGTDSNANPLFSLISPLDQRALERCSLFTRSESEAIITYLEYQAQITEFERTPTKHALSNYWRPSLDASFLAH